MKPLWALARGAPAGEKYPIRVTLIDSMKCEACEHENAEGARFCAKCGALLPTEHEGPDPLVGQLIGGRFRVTAELGEGGMGKVYVGEQQMGTTVRKVAIKTLHAHLSKDPSVLARFHRECGTVAQLEHPNTIKFFDFGATGDGTLYIAMEFVAGKPLSDVIQREGAISPERVIKIMRQVCGALDEAHMQGIIHRDLKPENIILTARAGETDFVKVLDFGIAARSESADAGKEQKLTQQGMVLGTPPYMSPEQFTGKALDVRSDIYSLGVMAYEMLTGKLPFEADTPWQWATQHMTVQPTPFEVSAPAKNIPGGLRDAILKSLAKDREQRQPTARDFFAELSGGGRMTVTGEVADRAREGTAAMAAAPDFGAPPAGHLSPAPIPGGRPGVPATAPAVVVPPPPATSRSSGGGKGLIVGLGAVGALLLIAMAVVAARSMKSGSDEQATLDIPTAQPSGEIGGTVVKPAFGPDETEPTAAPPANTGAAPEPDPTSKPPSKGTTKPPAKDPEKPTGTGGTGSATGGDSKGGTSSSGGGDSGACDACISAAKSGNLTGAAASYRSCGDAGKKAQCASSARGPAIKAARTAALNGNCSQATAIIQAAKAMGADTPKLASALDGSSCK